MAAKFQKDRNDQPRNQQPVAQSQQSIRTPQATDKVTCKRCETRIQPPPEPSHQPQCTTIWNGNVVCVKCVQYYHCASCDYCLCLKCLSIIKTRLSDCDRRQHKWELVTWREYRNKYLLHTEGFLHLKASDSVPSEKARRGQLVVPKKFADGEQNSSDPKSWLKRQNFRYEDGDDNEQLVIFTAGACINEQDNVCAGWSFIHRPPMPESEYSTEDCIKFGPLEKFGPRPDCTVCVKTKCRAELRAAVAALLYVDWKCEAKDRYKGLTIATDSEYITNAVGQCRIQKEFQEAIEAGDWQGNLDLWTLLLDEIKRLKSHDLVVSFWKISEAGNQQAKFWARKGAEKTDPVGFHDSGYYNQPPKHPSAISS